jgi:hypothetical protein
LELHKLLAKDARLRSELGFAAVPHRTTIERRPWLFASGGRNSGCGAWTRNRQRT